MAQRIEGHQYRLPTEAEWEHACRAGTTTAYSFGDNADELDAYAWFGDNTDGKLPNVGTKKPNPWGLHDMHGSVMEWVIDGHSPEGYAALAGKSNPIPFTEAIQWPKELSHRCLRGGGWEDDAVALRSAARVSSDDEAWKTTDPNIPKSPWWYTDDPLEPWAFACSDRTSHSIKRSPKSFMRSITTTSNCQSIFAWRKAEAFAVTVIKALQKRSKSRLTSNSTTRPKLCLKTGRLGTPADQDSLQTGRNRRAECPSYKWMLGF